MSVSDSAAEIDRLFVALMSYGAPNWNYARLKAEIISAIRRQQPTADPNGAVKSYLQMLADKYAGIADRSDSQMERVTFRTLAALLAEESLHLAAFHASEES